jgi:molybdopterin converting factor subunit 1
MSDSDPIHVQVLLFARARDLAGTDRVDLRLSAGTTVGQLRRRLVEEQPELAGMVALSALAVNNEFVDDASELPAGAEVALIPPVSGG